jgi:hypothetical protein
MKTEIESVEQTGADQRRLAAAGRAEDGEEAGRGQTIDHGVDTIITAEEKVRLVASEGSKSRIG